MKGIDKENCSILYFADYGKNFGGAANTLLQQAILMKQSGYPVVVFFSDYLGEGLQEEYQEIYRALEITGEWETYQLTSQPEDIDIVCMDRNYEKLRDKIASYHPALLHSVQINPCVELISRELNVPHIMNVYQMNPAFFSITYLNVFPHYHLCDSWYWAKKWSRYLDTDSQCIRTVVNNRKKRKERKAGHVLGFICVGAVYQEKNQLSAIKAFHMALCSGMRGKLTLCGYTGGKYAAECMRYVEDNRLGDHILIKGFCADMSKEYMENDVLLCASTRESYPNVISEAMAHGLVIVSTPVAGVPEVIVDGENGYLAKDYSPKSLYEKIMQAKNDMENGRVGELLDNAEETFWENHSPEKVKSQLIEYYKYVADDYERKACEGNRAAGIGMNEVRDIFESYLNTFWEKRERFTYPDIVASKLWYLYHIKAEVDTALERNCKFYIWGAGKYGTAVKELVEAFLPKIRLAGFIDTAKTGSFLDHNIFLPDEVLINENIIVFVAVLNGQDEVTKELERIGFVFNKEYFILSPRRW